MKKYRKFFLTVFLFSILLSAIHVESFSDWLLEISPVLLGIPLIWYLGKKFKLSDISYVCIGVYLVLPILQAHYGVAHVPFGFTIGKWMGVSRNMFDRLTHFSFGFLITYPLFEIMQQKIGKFRYFNFWMSASMIMGVSAIYEVFEWSARQFMSDRLSFLFIAAQADFWDTSKDLAMAFAGVIGSLVIMIIAVKLHEKYSLLRG